MAAAVHLTLIAPDNEKFTVRHRDATMVLIAFRHDLRASEN